MAQGSMVYFIVYISVFNDHNLISGVKRLVSEHEQAPLHHWYLRLVEEHDLPGDDVFWLVICMTARMSSRLIQVKRISIDTSFKRVHGWQEFEIKGWVNSHQRCKFDVFIYHFHCKLNLNDSYGVGTCIYDVPIG